MKGVLSGPVHGDLTLRPSATIQNAPEKNSHIIRKVILPMRNPSNKIFELGKVTETSLRQAKAKLLFPVLQGRNCGGWWQCKNPSKAPLHCSWHCVALCFA